MITKKIRSIYELLTILKDNISPINDTIQDGLCAEMYRLYGNETIKQNELTRLKQFVIKNMPVIYNIDNKVSVYGWPRKEWAPRLNWINQQLKKLNMKVSIIVAASENNIIGNDNKLLWTLKDDLKRFKKLTTGKVVIMGQKTYESLPIKPLPNRINIVITDNKNVNFYGCDMAYSIDQALFKASHWADDQEVFVIGGGSIYKQFMSIATKIYLTKVHETFQGDTSFPAIDDDKWKLISEEKYTKDQSNQYDFSFLIYDKNK